MFKRKDWFIGAGLVAIIALIFAISFAIAPQPADGEEAFGGTDAAVTGILEEQGVATRVVSMPCQEWFDAQSDEYKEQVLPKGVTKRVSIEAGIALGWAKYVGFEGASLSIETFGASASGNVMFEKLGFTVDNVVATAKKVLG